MWLNDLFWGIRNTFVGKLSLLIIDHLWGPSVHVDKSFKKIQALWCCVIKNFTSFVLTLDWIKEACRFKRFRHFWKSWQIRNKLSDKIRFKAIQFAALAINLGHHQQKSTSHQCVQGMNGSCLQDIYFLFCLVSSLDEYKHTRYFKTLQLKHKV